MKGGIIINMDTTSENLTSAISGLVGLRKENRSLAIERTANLFFKYLKEFRHDWFKRDLLKSFVSNETKTTTKNLIVKDIIRELESYGKIVIKTIVRNSKPFLRYRALNCMDGESYGAMMSKNGFKQVGYYNHEFDEKRKIPVRVLIARLSLGQEPDFDFDFSDLISTKSRANQKVVSNTPKSFTLTRTKNALKVYSVL